MCINFYYTAKLLSYTHINIYIIFHIFSIMVYHKILSIVFCVIQYDLVVYPFCI